jgi:hypothetical protein
MRLKKALKHPHTRADPVYSMRQYINKKQIRNTLALTILAIASSAVATMPKANAEANYRVYGIRTDFPMQDDQHVLKDFYITMGSSQGVKVGTQLDVYRSVPTSDEMNQKNAQNITFKIAHLKVIHVENSVAVARLLDMTPSKDTPNGIYANVMVGDAVEVSRK